MPKTKQKTKGTPFSFALTMNEQKAVLSVTGVIGWDTEAEDFCDSVASAKNAGCTELEVHITSCGGCCYNGVAMGDALLNCGMKTTAVVRGLAASMGSYLVQCCETRIAQPHATLMFHQPSAMVCGPVDEIAARAEHLLKLRDAMFEQMGSRIGMSGKELSAEHAVSKYYTAAEAKAKGFIDLIEGAEEEEEQADPIPENQEPETSGIFSYNPSMVRMMMASDQNEEEEEDEEDEGEKKPDKGKEPPAPPPAKPEEEEEEDEEEDGKKPDSKRGERAVSSSCGGCEENRSTQSPARGEGTPPVGAAQASADEIPLTRAEVARMIEQSRAETMASMGIPASALPGAGPAAPPSVSAAPTQEQFDAMNGLEKLEMTQRFPHLAMPH